MKVKSDLFWKSLIQNIFYIAFGASSIVGQNLLMQNFFKDAWISASVTITWALLLVVVYSYLKAEKEQRTQDLENSFVYHRLLRTDPSPKTVDVSAVAVPVDAKKLDISKIEIVHTMEQPAAEAKLPDFLKRDAQ